MKKHTSTTGRIYDKVGHFPFRLATGLIVTSSLLVVASSFADNTSHISEAKSGAISNSSVKAASPTSTGPSGEAMPTTAPLGWKRTFSDDFTMDAALGQFPNSPDYTSKWAAYDGFKDTSKHGTYSSAKVLSVSDGMLDIYLHSVGDIHYVGAPVANRWKGQLYGRYSVHFKSDSIPEYKTAWLLWPSSDKWNEGEIDFPEGNLDSHIGAFSHCANVNNPNANCGQAKTNAKYTSWHTATTEWTEGKVVWYLDGVQIGSCTKNVPNTPMRWTLQTETQLGKEPSSAISGHVKIDWVTIDSPDVGQK